MDRAWAERLAAFSGAIYLPLEMIHLLKHLPTINSVVLVSNMLVVVFMALRLSQLRKQATTD